MKEEHNVCFHRINLFLFFFHKSYTSYPLWSTDLWWIKDKFWTNSLELNKKKTNRCPSTKTSYEQLVIIMNYSYISQLSTNPGQLVIWWCRDGAVVRALASHQCGQGLIPRSGVKCGLSLLVLFSAPRGFLRVLRFPLSSKTKIWLDRVNC